MSGAVEICKRYAEMSSKREAADRAAGNEEGAAFESGSTITAMNLADQIARATTPCAAVEGAGLLPCPFCNNPMEDRGYGVMHTDGDRGARCILSGSAFPSVTAWNTRTTPPARSYADGVADAANVAEDLYANTAWHPERRNAAVCIAAAIRLLSQGEEA